MLRRWFTILSNASISLISCVTVIPLTTIRSAWGWGVWAVQYLFHGSLQRHITDIVRDIPRGWDQRSIRKRSQEIFIDKVEYIKRRGPNGTGLDLIIVLRLNTPYQYGGSRKNWLSKNGELEGRKKRARGLVITHSQVVEIPWEWQAFSHLLSGLSGRAEEHVATAPRRLAPIKPYAEFFSSPTSIDPRIEARGSRWVYLPQLGGCQGEIYRVSVEGVHRTGGKDFLYDKTDTTDRLRFALHIIKYIVSEVGIN